MVWVPSDAISDFTIQFDSQLHYAVYLSQSFICSILFYCMCMIKICAYLHNDSIIVSLDLRSADIIYMNTQPQRTPYQSYIYDASPVYKLIWNLCVLSHI